MRSPAFRFLAAHPSTVKVHIGTDMSTKRETRGLARVKYSRVKSNRTLHHVRRSSKWHPRSFRRGLKVLIFHRRYLFAIIYIEWPNRFNAAASFYLNPSFSAPLPSLASRSSSENRRRVRRFSRANTGGWEAVGLFRPFCQPRAPRMNTLCRST